MKHWMLVLLLTAACLLALGAQAEATYQGYESLDPKPEEAITFDGLTGEGTTWDASGAPTKDPKAMVIKDGIYVEAE